jgi:hypothetical protein
MGYKRRTLRKSKARRSTRRMQQRRRVQQGGVYEAEALRNFIQNAPNFPRSIEVYNTMVSPCILPQYPRIMYTQREGQNGEDIPVTKYLVLISNNQDTAENEEDVMRDIIYIIISAEDNTFTSATVDVISKYLLTDEHLKLQNPLSAPGDFHEEFEAEFGNGSREVLHHGANYDARRTAYEIILTVLEQLYRQPGVDGVREC